ncbi:hypothetical protein L596_027226 [Steinernema carpocapsae]|uniref:Cullin family profile domain-containing protein n=1 Tax=Steinernema carpocapsae TaxID=34508 RepID=A0A4U5M3R4_STECR|nr:hypothetical protein L596_027226 [Steinernema carpocapsae]
MAPRYTLDQAWEQIRGGLLKIFNHEPMDVHEYMTHYSIVYNYCVASVSSSNAQITMVGGGEGRLMYQAFERCLQDYIRQEFQKIYEVAEEEAQLNNYARLWAKYEFSTKVLDGIFRYLDRHWIKRIIEDELDSNVYRVQTLCMVSWSKVLFEANGINIVRPAMALLKRVADTFVAMGIQYKNEEDSVQNFTDDIEYDSDGIKTTEREQLKIYEDEFQKPLLEDTYLYYKDESNLFCSKDILTYMAKVKERIQEEVTRSNRYFYAQITTKRIKKKVEHAFIEDHLDTFQNAFQNLLKENAFSDLTLMYDLCHLVETAIADLKTGFRTFVIERGNEMMAEIAEADQNDPKVYIDTILKFHERYSSIVQNAFKGDNGFEKDFTDACIDVVNTNCITKKFNSRMGKSAEMLARFVDGVMKKGGNKDNEDTEHIFEKVMHVFRLLKDKDLFQKYYNRFYARRLLLDQSVNDDTEGAMITRLKNACGHEYTHTTQKMFADITKSKELTANFKQQEVGKIKTDANILVLGTGTWPLTQAKTFEVPPVLAEAMSAFTAYYTHQHQGRKLTWLLGQSRGEVTYKATSKMYTFVVTASQIAVLFKFNEAVAISFTALQDELCPHLHPGFSRQGRPPEAPNRR